MKTKKKVKVLETALITSLLLLLFSQHGYSSLSIYLEGSGIQLTALNGGTLSFGTEDHGITIAVTSGTLNGTSSFTYWREKGRVYVTSEDTAEYTLTAYGDRTSVYYFGTLVNQANASLVYGSTVTGDSLVFGWAVATEPLLPIMFIIGIVGVGSFFGGLIVAAYKIRDGEYVEGFRYAVIFCSIGFGLIWGWLNL